MKRRQSSHAGTWSSASISSRSSPVAIGITSSTLVLVPAASEEKRKPSHQIGATA